MRQASGRSARGAPPSFGRLVRPKLLHRSLAVQHPHRPLQHGEKIAGARVAVVGQVGPRQALQQKAGQVAAGLEPLTRTGAPTLTAATWNCSEPENTAALGVMVALSVTGSLYWPDAGATEVTVISWKLAVTDCGPLIVTVVDALVAEATGPVQAANRYPAAGVALTGARLAASGWNGATPSA